MKNALMKFAGFFVEKVPIEEPQRTGGTGMQGHGGAGAQPGTLQPYPGQGAAAPSFHDPMAPQVHHPQQQQPQVTNPFAQPATPGLLQGHWNAPAGPAGGAPQPRHAPLAIALRAWVPQEYAGYLTPYALHVIAAGGELTVEQARAYGAQALVVSSECLGAQTTLLTSPQLPTVFVAPQAVSIPERAGLVQVQEPLRASELAAAVRDAVASWAGGVA